VQVLDQALEVAEEKEAIGTNTARSDSGADAWAYSRHRAEGPRGE